jgi:GPH family glycoside/pentoside/hexuronide:cation symporter
VKQPPDARIEAPDAALPSAPPATGAAPALPARDPVPLSRLAAFAAPLFGLSTPFFFVLFYYFKFATDVLGIAPLVFGLIFGIGRVWDAISDPLAGLLSDRTRTRFGRRRPWLFAAIPLFAASVLMCWNPPATLTGTEQIVWVSASLFLFFTAFTMYGVPHQALGAELSEDYHERSRIFGARHISFTIGMTGAFGFMHVASNADDVRAAVSDLSVLPARAASRLLSRPPLPLPAPPHYMGRGGASPMQTLRDVTRNPHARLLIAVWFIESMGIGILGILSPYQIEYVLMRKDMTAVLPAAFVATLVLSVPIWVWISQKIGKRDAWRSAMVLGGLGFGATFFAGPGDIAFMAVTLVVAGFAFGCGGAVGPSILADVIDYDEYETGERKEGAYSSAQGLALKLANAAIIGIAGAVLEFSGFVPNVEQTEGTKLILQGVYAGLPFTMLLLAAFVFRKFSLTAAEHAQIRATLDERAATA